MGMMSKLAEDDRLDHVFHALANRTRRALLAQPRGGTGARHRARRAAWHVGQRDLEASVRAGAGRADPPRRRAGTSSPACSTPAPMATADEWIGVYRRFWSSKLDRFAEFVEKQKG